VGSWNWQWNSFNQLKTGFEFRYNKIAELKSFRYSSSTDWTEHSELYMNRGLNETYYPIQFATYIQNKMEFESMILNLGLRYDYFNANRNWFATNNIYQFSVNPEYDEGLDSDGDQVDSNGNIKYCWENVSRARKPMHITCSVRAWEFLSRSRKKRYCISATAISTRCRPSTECSNLVICDRSI
jgi:hypothetical protein